jgi:hypothetical protein
MLQVKFQNDVFREDVEVKNKMSNRLQSTNMTWTCSSNGRAPSSTPVFGTGSSREQGKGQTETSVGSGRNRNK